LNKDVNFPLLAHNFSGQNGFLTVTLIGIRHAILKVCAKKRCAEKLTVGEQGREADL
jgi:hypothetical protein